MWLLLLWRRYYKRLEMPEMRLLQLVADPSRLSWSHSNATLTVNYSKPPALIAEVRLGCLLAALHTWLHV
jgi:hypothetical protein